MMTPEKIGKYTVLALLGRGGMGEVYLGEDPYIGRRVAIKIIKGADPDARDRFLHEARVIGGLAHPAIVSLLDFDFSGDEPFLVMEYLKGEGLDAWIKKPHSLPEKLVVLDDLCQALSYAHQNGVLHRDVKPSNVQILPNGHAKLMDFGIARGSAGRLTATGAVLGTPEYMAPEILNDAAYSTQSDLYACAVLLYEMFTGANPFTAKTVAASLTSILTLDPPPLREARPELPARLCDVVMACLRKEPEQRPDGPQALIAAGREAQGQPSEAVPETRAIPQSPPQTPPVPGAFALPRPESGRPKPPWAAMGAVAVVAMMSLVWALNRTPPPTLPNAEIVAGPSPAAAHATVTPSPRSPPPVTPTPEKEPASTPRPARSTRPESTPTGFPPARSEVEPAATLPPPPTPTPVLAPAAGTIEPTPSSRASPVGVPGPTVAPTQPATPKPSLSGVSPKTVRRGSSVTLEIEGRDLRRDLTASVLQGRRPAAGIKVVREEFATSALFRVTILIEPEVPLGTYTLILRDASGALTPGVQVEVVL